MRSVSFIEGLAGQLYCQEIALRPLREAACSISTLATTIREEWAYQHDLPYFDDEVHFPDVRIDYQEPDGRWEREDIEVVTPHYRGAHGASVARSGFSCYRGISLRVSGRSGGGSRRLGGLAEELWR